VEVCFILIKCSNCGKKNTKKSKFCYSCGSSLKSNNQTTKSPPNVKVVKPLDLTSPSSIGDTSTMNAPDRIANPQEPGMCNYHPGIPATYVCSRCGNKICINCVKSYGQLLVCPQCYSPPINR
jgi:hypothetical protein